MFGNKRGLSTVVTTLIIILLVLVAVGIVWVVIRNVISEGAEEISLGKLTIDLQIKNVNVTPGGIDVKIKRNIGRGELSGIKFLVSDGVKTEDFEMPTTMGELAEQTFILNYTGLVKEISIAPILGLESGEQSVGNEIDKEVFSNKEIMENLGAVSWWRFEGNANDEVGNNDGTIMGADCNVAGKFGKACDFDGVDDYIDAGTDASLDLTQTLSLSVWIKANSQGYYDGILGKTPASWQSGYGMYLTTTEVRFWVTSYNENVAYETLNVDGSNWHHVVGTYDGSTVRIFVDGVVGTSDSYSGPISTTADNFEIGLLEKNPYNFDGIIDEPMVFNRALSEDEVRALYESDLG